MWYSMGDDNCLCGSVLSLQLGGNYWDSRLLKTRDLVEKWKKNDLSQFGIMAWGWGCRLQRL
jgi:hypothetical protein